MTAPRPLFLGLFFACTLSQLACPGDGSDGPAPIVRFASTPECLTLAGKFPSGFAKLPGTNLEALAIQFSPPALIRVELENQPPTQAYDAPALPEVSPGCGSGIDSDSDGLADADRARALGFGVCPQVQPGTLLPLDGTRVAITTSDIEQILFADPRDGALRHVDLDPPAAGPGYVPADWPFWPAPGVRPFRTAFSTLTCVEGPGLADSLGDPILSPLRCDPRVNGFFTRLTADVAEIDDRLFVATSNLIVAPRFSPGTVLVFDYDESADPPRVGPHPTNAVIFTSAFNPTSLQPYTTPGGRQLLLVGITGSILPDGSAVVTDSAIDVIDATTLTLIATIPLGPAGLGFSRIEIDPTNRIGLAGSAIGRALYAIDLTALDDPMLGLGPQTLPIVLDGMTPGFPDARVFTAANPFALPKRSDGPLDSICFSATSVAIKDDGSFAAASDSCDGTITRLVLNLPTLRTDPIDPLRVLVVDRLIRVAAPLVPSAIGETRDIGRVLIRDGTPAINFAGPDVHYLAGREEGAVCGVRVDAI